MTDQEAVLDLSQLRDVTLDDAALMREILETLLEDTSRQLPLLEIAIRNEDAGTCARLAHYCKGACANVGAQRAASALLHIERRAAAGDLPACAESLHHLSREMELLRVEAEAALNG